MQVFDRALVAQDFTGQLASAPNSGGVDEPGILDAVKVGDWDFANARSCYDESSDQSACSAPERSPFARRLALTRGSFIGDGHRDLALTLDGAHWIDDPADPYYGLATSEYGRSQKNVAAMGSPIWQNTPVLRTDESFSVSVWVRPVQLGRMTAVSQIGTRQSAFSLGSCQAAINGATEYRWCLAGYGFDGDMQSGNSATAKMSSRALAGEDLDIWTHLIAVYDANAHQLRLYVNGQLEGVQSINGVFNATGPLVAGAAQQAPNGGAGGWVDFWTGDIDDLGVYQGALTDAAVKRLFDEESVDPVGDQYP